MAQSLPWQVGQAIFEVVRDWDGAGDAELVLPDEPLPDPTQIRWSAGSMDGVARRHFGVVAEDADGIGARLRRLASGQRDVPGEIVSRSSALFATRLIGSVSRCTTSSETRTRWRTLMRSSNVSSRIAIYWSGPCRTHAG